MMKKILLICMVFAALTACNDPYENTTFAKSDMVPNGTYLESHSDEFSEWVAILKYADLYNAINQSSATFTVFAPTNEALKKFYASKHVSTIQELGYDYARDLAKYHLVNYEISQKTFLLGGRLSYPTLSDDYLTVTFDTNGEDSESAMSMNGEASVKKMAITTTNGLVYVLNGIMTPITETLYDRVNTDDFKIFRAAIDVTGWNARLKNVYDTVTLENGSTNIIKRKYTLLAVPDEVFAQSGITSLSDLSTKVNAETDYTSADNALNKYVAYHMFSSAYFAEDLFKFTEADTILLWGTQAPGEVITTSNINGVNYLNQRVVDADSFGTQLIDASAYLLAKNGVIHQVNDLLTIYAPKAITTYWDFGNYPEFESMVNNWGATNGFGACYKTFLSDQNGKLFDLDVTYKNFDFITCTPTSSNNNWSSIGYCVLGNLDSGHTDKDYFGVGDNGGAYNHDVLVVNVGYMGKVTITSPTIIKGKYKVTLYFAYDRSLEAFYKESSTKCKFSMDNASIETSLHTNNTNGQDNVNGNTGVRHTLLWDEINFSATSTHEFSLVPMDPRASTYSQYRLFLDYLKFEPID